MYSGSCQSGGLGTMGRCCLVGLLIFSVQTSLWANQDMDSDSLLVALKSKVESEIAADNFGLTGAARDRIVVFLEGGLDELASAPDRKEARKRFDKAMKNCEKLARELMKESRKRSRDDMTIRLEDVRSGIRSLCPLYPFC